MWIIPNDDYDPERIKKLVDDALDGSRFYAHTEVMKFPRSSKFSVKISDVRLRNKKSYCGAHPGPCVVRFAFTRKRPVCRYLEGLDWVGFNAMLNDVLDVNGVSCQAFSFNREAVNVYKGKYFIRIDRRRRTAYPYAYSGTFPHWTQTREDLTNAFEDFVGKLPPAMPVDTLDGTPGYPCYTLEEEMKFAAELHDDH